MTSNISDFTNIFSDEISLRIFSFLEPNNLARSSEVSKNWYRLTTDDCLWNLVIKKYFNYLSFPKECQTIKTKLSKVLVLAQSEIKSQKEAWKKTMKQYKNAIEDQS